MLNGTVATAKLKRGALGKSGSVGKQSLHLSVLSSWLGGSEVIPCKRWKTHQTSTSYFRSTQLSPCSWVCAQLHPAWRQEAADTGRWDLWCKAIGEMTFDRYLQNYIPSSNCYLWLRVWGQFLIRPYKVHFSNSSPPFDSCWSNLQCGVRLVGQLSL